VHCGQTVGRIKMKLDVQVGLGPGHIVLDGDPVLPPPKGHSPHYGAYLLRPNGCMDQDVTWYRASPQPRQSPPHQFSAHFYCGQTAGCIKIQDASLGIEIGFSPGGFVLDGDPAP